ncbi:flagellar motor switch protein FliM [bacterium]|nr:flagellar motor switch protein FliM [bacterium]
MGKILSQEEIDALLSSVSDTGIEDQPDSSMQVQLYDFKHPERISKEQMRALRTIHEGFARMFATYLSTSLRTLVDVNLLSIDQVTFSEYSLSLSLPNALYLLRMEELEGKAILEINPQFLLFAVDRMLGGGGDTEIEPREISQIEQNVIIKMMTNIIKQLNEVWMQIAPLGVSIDRFESDPQFVQIARSSDTIAIIFFDIRVRGMTYTMNLVFPYFTLEPIMNKLSAQGILSGALAKGDDRESEIVKERLKSSKLPLQVVLANTDIKVRDFIKLDSDDLLKIEKNTSEPMEVLIGRKLKFFGSPGRVGRHKAVKIIRSITHEEELIYDQR